MGIQKLGLGPDESLDSEERFRRGGQEALDETLSRFDRFLDRVFESRWAPTFIMSVGVATLLFVFDWAGYSKYGPWLGPRPLSKIWWHFPAYAVATAVALTIHGKVRDKS